MAQIPMGNFDAPQVASRSGTSRVDNSATEQVGRAAARLGNVAMQVGERATAEATQQKAEENAKIRRDAELLARAKAANATAQYGLQVEAARAEVEDTLRRGGDYSQVDSRFSEAVGKIPVPTIEGLPPEVLETYNGGIANTRERGRLQLSGAVVSARRDDGERQFNTLLETQAQAAALPGADIDAIHAQTRAALPLYREFGLDGSTIEKAQRAFEDRNWTNHVASRYNANNDSVEALTALLGEVTAGEGGYAGKLEPDKRNAMAARIGQRIDVLQGKAERKTDKLDTLVERTLNAIDTQTATGIPPTIEQRAAWADVVKQATPAQREQFAERAREEQEVHQLLRLPIGQQVEAVQKRHAQLYSEGADPRDQANFARVKTAVEANVKMLREEPLLFAQTREGDEIPGLDLAALGTPDGMQAIGVQLQDRAQKVAELQKQYGPQVSTRLLLPQEAAMLVTALDALPPKKRVAMFGSLRQITGSDDAYLSVMQQVQPDAPVLALAGMLNIRGERGRIASQLIVQGESILKGGEVDGKVKGVKLPPAADFEAAVAESVGTAFAGRADAYAVAMQAIRAAYAGDAARAGDVSGTVDTRRMKDVIKIVVGEKTEINGRGEVFLPYGMDADDFDDGLERAWSTFAAKLPAGNARDFDRYGLRQVGNGKYYVTEGRTFVSDPDGNPMVLEVTR